MNCIYSKKSTLMKKSQFLEIYLMESVHIVLQSKSYVLSLPYKLIQLDITDVGTRVACNLLSSNTTVDLHSKIGYTENKKFNCLQ